MTHCKTRWTDPEVISVEVTQTGDEIISVEEFKEHAKIPPDDTSEDNVIAIYIGNACRTAENYTGRVCRAAAWKSTIDFFPSRVTIPVLPIDASSIVVKYYDQDNVEQTLASTEYQVRSRGQNEYTEIIFDGTIPNTYDKIGAVVIEYDAGYGTIPAPFKNECLNYAAAKFENRQSEVLGSSANALDMGFYQALFPYKLL